MTAPNDTLRKVVIHRAGSFDRLTIETAPGLIPGPGEVVVDCAASGINYADVIVRMGLYASAKELVGWPITPGFEVSGTVRALGEGVEGLEVGQRVLAVTLFDGYASQVCVAAHQVFPLPDELDDLRAAGLPAVFMTAWMALRFLAHPRPGDTLLVHSAAGGVGSSLVQLGKALDCRVIGVVGRSHKVEMARELGADVVIDKSTQDLWTAVRQAAPEGVDVALDANGVSTLQGSYDSLRPAGKLVIYGFGSMLPRDAGRPNPLKLAWDWLRTPRFNPLELTNQSKSILAFNLSYLFDRTDLLADGMGEVMDLLARGVIQAPPATAYPFDEVARAHRDIQSGNTTGKLVLVHPGGDQVRPSSASDR